MITFHSRQSDDARHIRKNENADTFNFTSQIASSICTIAFTKCEKSDATIFTSRCSRTVMCYRFRGGQALPLSQAKVLRLANGSSKLARCPARWPRDDREMSGKTSGEMSRATVAQYPRNRRAAADAMSPDGRQDNLQDSLHYADAGRTASAPETGKTIRNLFTQWRRNSRATSPASNS